MKFRTLAERLLAARINEGPAYPVDTSGITAAIQRAFVAAGLDTQSGPLKEVNDTIEQALAAAGLRTGSNAPRPQRAAIDGVARRIDAPEPSSEDGVSAPTEREEKSVPGEFVTRSFTNHAGTRAYKLYVPASRAGACTERLPMVVMLHGCTQSPDDFAAGTRMNLLAEEHGFIVVYPSQAAGANGSRCWNWFRSDDQRRDRGEPALIAGITREVAASHGVDERRIFVAGLSAGAAMAVILGTTHPDLFAAVGVHSGLPYGAAWDVPSAYQAMRRGAASEGQRKDAGPIVPTIVFHGDSDTTVDVRNGVAIVAHATVAHPDAAYLRLEVHEGVAPGGRRYRRSVYSDSAQRPVVEQWLLHDAGHAWSGGSPNGTFTDAAGPDASSEMIRFFYSQQRAGTA